MINKQKNISFPKFIVLCNGNDYGNALIFDPDLLHKSDSPNNSRITLQLRYEEIQPNNFRRSVTQKVDPKVLQYWKKKLL